MNRFYNRIALTLLAVLLLGGSVYAQFTTTFAKNASAGQQNGLYYSLPQTMLQLDFVVAETTFEEGPLSDYADTYFETSAYDSFEGTSYELLDVRMTSKAIPDPNATFFVSVNMGRGVSKPLFNILPNGIIRSVGVWDKDDAADECLPETTENTTLAVVPSVAQNAFPLLTAGKTNAQLAKEAADKIEEIRKAKFYLISGDVEMAHHPETFEAMFARLDEMEQQYLSLFMGKRTTRQTVRTVYVTPNKETPTQTVAKFSETEGLTIGTNGRGTAITVQTLPLNSTQNINAPSPSAIESMSYENKVMYRIPETANVRVAYGSRTLMEQRQTVSQLGVLLVAPLQGAKLVFDTETGQIVSMKYQ